MGQFDAPAAVKKKGGKVPQLHTEQGTGRDPESNWIYFFQLCFWIIRKFLALVGQGAKFAVDQPLIWSVSLYQLNYSCSR